MIVTIVGGGPIGSAIAQELAARPHITEIRVCDAKSRPLKSLANQISDRRVHSYQINAKDRNGLFSVAEGSSCIVAATDPSVNPMLASLAVELGAHFCDNGGSDDIARQVLQLHEPAKGRGVWVVPNCGLSPGLVEILCLYGVEKFDTARTARIRVGNLPLAPEDPFNFRLSTSAHKVVEDYSHHAHVIVDGEIESVEPLSNIEHVFFREPFGLLEAFSTAGSVVLLAGALSDRVQELDLKTITWPGHADHMKFVLGLGFGESKNIDIRTHLTYRDILVRAMQKHLGGMHKDAVLVRVLVSGIRDGQEQTMVLEMIDTFDDETGMSAMRRCTGIPAAIITDMLITGQIDGGGASPPEQAIDKSMFLTLLGERGLHVSETWYDGSVNITDQTEHQGTAV
ncbi:MAG: saccharopine dehydrogenase [Rhodothermales bacterium]|nr:saccharopine dehydrogenase [Rhodothermales bacterium]